MQMSHVHYFIIAWQFLLTCAVVYLHFFQKAASATIQELQQQLREKKAKGTDNNTANAQENVGKVQVGNCDSEKSPTACDMSERQTELKVKKLAETYDDTADAEKIEGKITSERQTESGKPILPDGIGRDVENEEFPGQFWSNQLLGTVPSERFGDIRYSGVKNSSSNPVNLLGENVDQADQEFVGNQKETAEMSKKDTPSREGQVEKAVERPKRKYKTEEGSCSSKDTKQAALPQTPILPCVTTSNPIPTKGKKCPRCPASCIPECLIFVLRMMNVVVCCPVKLFREIQSKLERRGSELRDETTCLSLEEALTELNLVERVYADRYINGNLDEALRNGMEKLRKWDSYIGLLILRFLNRDIGHCLVMMHTKDDRPEVELQIYDVQGKCWWPLCKADIAQVKSIRVYNVNKAEFVRLFPPCESKCCGHPPVSQIAADIRLSQASSNDLHFTSIPCSPDGEN